MKKIMDYILLKDLTWIIFRNHLFSFSIGAVTFLIFFSFQNCSYRQETTPQENSTLREPSSISSQGTPHGLTPSSAIGVVSRAQEEINSETVRVTDFGASSDATPDVNNKAFKNAIEYCKTLIAPKLVVPRGKYHISESVLFDLPDNSSVEFVGELFASLSNRSAVTLGSASRNVFGMRVTGLSVTRTSVDASEGSIGVQIRNLVFSNVDIRKVQGFQNGIYVYGTKPNGGVSYNQFHLGMLHDNKINLQLAAAENGYTNENTFFGGSFNHSSNYPNIVTYNLVVDHNPIAILNNNRFLFPSFEDNSTLAIAASIEGHNNLIFHPRVENPKNQSNYKIIFGKNSQECELKGHGFALSMTNISDLGFGNSYEVRETRTVKRQTVAAGPGTPGVHQTQSTASGNAKLYRGLDPSGIEAFYLTANGSAVFNKVVYSEAGLRFSSSDGSRNDRGIYIGVGSPNGVIAAGPGSLYLNSSGGTNATFYVKESGTGNSGWVAK